MENHLGKLFLNYWRGVYVTNLKERKDRKKDFKTWMSKVKFDKYNFVTAYPGLDNFRNDWKNLDKFLAPYKDFADVDAIVNKWDPKETLNIPKMYRGSYACTETNRRIILDAYNKGIDHVLIFEDDAVPTHAFNTHVGKFLKTINNLDWDLITFGTGPTKFEIANKWETNGIFSKLTDGSITQFHSYAVHSKFYEEFLEVTTRRWRTHLDVEVSKHMSEKGFNLYATNPRFFIQQGGESSIQGKDIAKGGGKDALFPDLLK